MAAREGQRAEKDGNRPAMPNGDKLREGIWMRTSGNRDAAEGWRSRTNVKGFLYFSNILWTFLNELFVQRCINFYPSLLILNKSY